MYRYFGIMTDRKYHSGEEQHFHPPDYSIISHASVALNETSNQNPHSRERGEVIDFDALLK